MIDSEYNPDLSPEEVDESSLTDFTDHTKLRDNILTSVKDSFSKKFPMEDGQVRLEVSNLRYNDARRPEGLVAAKKALMGGGTLGVPLHGDVRLFDKVTGDLLDEKKGHLLANVPWLTNRGTFVMRGTEYVTFNQSLLRPGIFSRIKENGELEAHINVKSGTGPGMRLFMEPDTGVYRISLGTSKIKLYPVLRSLGKTDEDLEKAWGKDVLDLNRKASDTRSFGRFYDKLIGNRGPAMIARLTNQEPMPHFDDDDGPDEVQKEAAFHSTIEEARDATHPSPSEAQRKAGNYPMGHFLFHGLDVTIENAKGSTRSGKDKKGTPWSVVMKHDYGYVRSVWSPERWSGERLWPRGHDGDHVDVFLGPDHKSEVAYVVDQSIDGKFDEHKVMLGFSTVKEAKQAYFDNYSAGWKGFDDITPITLIQFKWWLEHGDRHKPFCGQQVKTASLDLAPGISGVGGIGATKDMGAAPALPTSPAASMLTDLRKKRQAGVPSLKTAADISDEERSELIRRQLSRMEVDPEVSFRTMGKAHRNVDSDTLLDASSKLLAVARGDAEPDDRDALWNKWFRTPDDMFSDRVTKDAGKISQALFWRSRYDRSLKRLKPGHFTPQLHGLVVGNSLSQAVSGINPVEFMDLRLKVVQTGEGGIGSTDMIPDSAREVHPSQMGFIDYIKTPESTSVGVDQRFAWSVKKGPGNQIYTKVLGKDGNPVWRTPSQLYGKKVGFPDSSSDPVTFV